MDGSQLVAQQRAFFESGRTLSADFRKASLSRLLQGLARWEKRLLAAAQADLRKPPVETYASELGLVKAEIRYLLPRLGEWMRDSPRRAPRLNRPGRSWVRPRPRGVVLIIGPWNYPFQLLLSPLAGALAAGNCAVLKPSELAPHSAKAVAGMTADLFPADYCRVVAGGPDAARDLLRARWDHIFFTGSSRVGRQVAAAAAEYLTPVTLELGGKNPCVVWKDAPLRLTAERIVRGKWLNAGQTCVAPDHLWVHRDLCPALETALVQNIRRFYGDDPHASPDYGRLINASHYDRLAGYLSDGDVQTGGNGSREELYLAPTLLSHPQPDSPVMTEEVFGPILPFLEFDDLEDCLAAISRQPKPLAAYCFARSKAVQKRFLESVQAGGIGINEVVTQAAASNLPFGGVGESGFGAYHGRASFDAFSHYQSIVRRPLRGGRYRNPPYRLPYPWFKFIFDRLAAS